MIKALSLLKRKAGSSRASFREHYESVHVPLALPLLRGLRRYVRYHVEEEMFGDADFDVLTLFGYRDKAATDEVFRELEGEAGRAILDDELVFMDKPANRSFCVSERTLVGDSSKEGDAALFVLVSRPQGMSRFDASARFVRDHWPKLSKLAADSSFVILRDAFPMVGGELPYDQVLQLAPAPARSIESWAKPLEEAGYRVVAVATKRFETFVAAPD